MKKHNETLLVGEDALLDSQGRLLDGAEELIKSARGRITRFGLLILDSENIVGSRLSELAVQRHFDYVTPTRTAMGRNLGAYHRHAIENLSAQNIPVYAAHGSWTGLLEARSVGCTAIGVMSESKHSALPMDEHDMDIWLPDLAALDSEINKLFR